MVVAAPLIFLFPKNVVFELSFVLIAFPALVALSATIEPVSQAQRIFKAPGISISSYTIYALHKPLYQLLLGLLKQLLPIHPETFALWIGIIYIPLLIVFCVFIDFVYDAPFRRMLTGIVTARVGGPRLKLPQ
jgi:peptidoglycan/LPS O-acetylase OafA/YrhL